MIHYYYYLFLFILLGPDFSKIVSFKDSPVQLETESERITRIIKGWCFHNCVNNMRTDLMPKV